MSIVTVAEALPTRLLAIYGSVLARNGGETRERLKAQMAPPSLRRGQNNESTAVFDASLREARAVGLLTEEGLNLAVPTAVRPAARQREEEAFLANVLRVLCDEALAEESGQSRVAPAICWLLLQDPLRPLPWSENPLPKLQRQLGGDDTLDLINATRLQTLSYWARYLGFARLVGAGQVYIVPDPHDAILRVLPQVFGFDASLKASDFRKRLADLCPVLEGGNIRNRLEEQARGEIARTNPQRLSRSTSLALIRLESCGRIELQQSSDAEISILDIGTSDRRFSHVVLKAR